MQDTISKVVFMGAPSTGKSTICKRAAEFYKTQKVDEYGRTYWEQNQHQRRLSPEQLLHIAQEHIAIEERAIVAANQFLFVDTNPLTTWHFALDYHGSSLPELSALADQCKARYDYWFLCDTDIPFEDTWERSGAVKQASFQRFIRTEMDRRGIHYHVLSGSVERRLEQIQQILNPVLDTLV